MLRAFGALCAGPLRAAYRVALRAQVDEKRQERVNRLQAELRSSGEQSSTVKDELQLWTEKVAQYEQRFHKISQATGLSRPDDIVNKFFSNDEVEADLKRELAARQAEIVSLTARRCAPRHAALRCTGVPHGRCRNELAVKLEEAKSGFVVSKWRDVDALQTRKREEDAALSRSRNEFEQSTQQLAVMQEGVQELAANIDKVLGSNPRLRPPPSFATTQEACLWWVSYVERQLTTLHDEVTRNINRRNTAKRRAKAQARAARPAGTSPVTAPADKLVTSPLAVPEWKTDRRSMTGKQQPLQPSAVPKRNRVSARFG